MSNQSLQELLCERVSIFANSDRPKEIIDAGIEKLFKDVVDDAFRNYGDMGKAIKEAFKAALPSNVSNTFELTRYNSLIENAIRNAWENSGIEGEMLRRANEALSEVVKEDALPELVSLRALLEAFCEAHKEQAMHDQWEHPEIRIKESEYGGVHIYFDKDPESSHRRFSSRSDHQLDNAIHISCSEKEADVKGNKIGTVYAAKLDGDPIGRQFKFHSKWERLIAALYFGGAKVIVDCDADDIGYGLYD